MENLQNQEAATTLFEKRVLFTLHKIKEARAHVAFHRARPRPDEDTIEQWQDVATDLVKQLIHVLSNEGIRIRSDAETEAMA